MSFPFIRQQDEMDCGAVCLQMIAKSHGRLFSITDLRDKCFTNESGSSMFAIGEAAESYGLKTSGFRCSTKQLVKEASFPHIAHWNENHFVVVYKASKRYVWVADPAVGKIKYSLDEFARGFEYEQQSSGIILTLEPTTKFYDHENSRDEKTSPWRYLLSHLRYYKSFTYQIFLSAVLVSILSILLPMLTQGLIDEGVVNVDYSFIKLILVAQLLLFIGKLSFEALKNWIILHWSYRVNISVISSFLMEFLGLSAAQLSRKTPADVLQRVEDYQHVEDFLANTSINLVLSIFTLIFFSVFLIAYEITIFFVFLLGTLLSVLWVLIFQKRRKAIYYKLIGLMTQNKSKVIDIIDGIQEIKNYGIERRKRWEWEEIQIKEYRTNLKNLEIEQSQEIGFQALNEFKNIAMIFIGALFVIQGDLSIGALLAIAFISGQLNSSLSFIPSVLHIGQEAKVSLERLIAATGDTQNSNVQQKVSKFQTGAIKIENLSYTYDGDLYALDDISLTIEKGKTIAIVGSSGSGKSTLLKLLTKFLSPTEGSIKVEENSLAHLDETIWRKKIGIVLQDGHIFPDTILNNICLSAQNPSLQRAILCARIANVHQDIDELPNGYHTKIGENGIELSKGQNQRIQIARAIYKNPEYLFFDEATSSLDSVNERIIQRNLDKIFQKKTVLIIAHRLSTVQKADHIIVLDKGQVIETGDHNSLVERRGFYFQLVKDQLILGE